MTADQDPLIQSMKKNHALEAELKKKQDWIHELEARLEMANETISALREKIREYDPDAAD